MRTISNSAMRVTSALSALLLAGAVIASADDDKKSLSATEPEAIDAADLLKWSDSGELNDATRLEYAMLRLAPERIKNRELLFQCLKDASILQRRKAIEALWRTASGEDVPPCIETLKQYANNDPDFFVRHTAAEGLASLGASTKGDISKLIFDDTAQLYTMLVADPLSAGKKADAKDLAYFLPLTHFDAGCQSRLGFHELAQKTWLVQQVTEFVGNDRSMANYSTVSLSELEIPALRQALSKEHYSKQVFIIRALGEFAALAQGSENDLFAVIDRWESSKKDNSETNEYENEPDVGNTPVVQQAIRSLFLVHADHTKLAVRLKGLRSRNDAIGIEARRTLLKLGDEAELSQFLMALEKKTEENEVIDDLLQITYLEQRAEPALDEILTIAVRSQSGGVKDAVKYVFRFGGRTGQSHLISALGKESDDDQEFAADALTDFEKIPTDQLEEIRSRYMHLSPRVRSFCGLVLAKNKGLNRQVIEDLFMLAQSGNPDANQVSAFALSKSHLPQEFMPQLQSLLLSPDAEIRIIAAHSLANQGEAAQQAVTVLQSFAAADVIGSLDALRTLGRIHGEQSVRALLPFCKHKNASFRVNALNALGFLGADAEVAMPEIKAAIHDPEVIVRLNAACALHTVGRESEQAAVELGRIAVTLDFSSKFGPGCNELALASIRELSLTELVNKVLIEDCLKFPAGSVRMQAAMTLHQIQPEREEELLIKVMQGCRSEDISERAIAISALPEFQTRRPEREWQIQLALRDREPAVRKAAEKALQQTRNSRQPESSE